MGLHISDEALAEQLSGNSLADGSTPIAQAYAGHQFGHFNMLGDGRAHLLGEHTTPNGITLDVQLKGSGRTPYSRRGDGRASLSAMLREYVMSEAMEALHIPTTRSLAVVATGEPIYRETALPGAILTRVAASHIRVGTFQYAATLQDKEVLQALADYTIARHYPELEHTDQPYRRLLEMVMERQITLVTHWLRVGFIHGVMNTDNMAISGETIDYGPCAFMDTYDPQTVFSSIDHQGRYAYGNQPHIAKWNLARLAEALLPLLHDEVDQAASLAENLLDTFNTRFETAWLGMMRGKLGMSGEDKSDASIVGGFLKWMQRHEADYTNSFRAIMSEDVPSGDIYRSDEFIQWHQTWKARLQQHAPSTNAATGLMQTHNPARIPRNHQVEHALEAAQEQEDMAPLHALLDALAEPYHEDTVYAKYTTPPTPQERVYQTFCGT